MKVTKRIADQDDDLEDHDSGISHESDEREDSPSSENSADLVEEYDEDEMPIPAGQYEVEEIRDYFRDKNGDLYEVKWKGWEDKDNTWEPPSSLLSCYDAKLAFFLKRKAEIQENTSSEYITTANGTKRRKGSKQKLHLPPDPRPLEPRAIEFYDATRHPSVDEIKKYERIWKTDFQKKLGKGKQPKVESITRWHRAHLDQALIDASTCGLLTAEADADLRKQLFIHQRDEWRESATDELKDWETRLNEISEAKPLLKVENTVDWAGPPKGFTYVNDYVPAEGITIPDDPPVGCSCSDCYGEKKVCCAAQFGTQFAYTAHKKVRVPAGTPIYECNNKCQCGPECPNRVVQDGRVNTSDLRLCIFRTSNERGWGVKTLKKIKKMTFVSLYLGEIITSEEAEKRGKDYDRNGCTYLFDLDINEGKEANRFTVDAGNYGNITHFINHSCDPNLAVYSVFVNCLDPDLPKLALFTTRDISSGEELSFDYEYRVTDSEPENDSGDDKLHKQNCFCGSANCRKYFF